LLKSLAAALRLRFLPQSASRSSKTASSRLKKHTLGHVSKTTKTHVHDPDLRIFIETSKKPRSVALRPPFYTGWRTDC
jgi:hypothetical protein